MGDFMRKRTLIALLAFSLIAIPSFSTGSRDWQTGKLVSIEEGSTEGVGLGGMYAECKNWLYRVETETMTYVFSTCADHPRPFTIGAQMKFALGTKQRAFLIDEDGKEFKVRVTKKTPNRPAQLSGRAESVEPTAAKDSGAEKSPESGAPGTLAVTTTPEAAEVYVDGAFVGNAPSTLRLAPGQHTVKVTASGYNDWSRTVSVSGGSESKLVVNLEKL